jgi:hypothetical protein
VVKTSKHEEREGNMHKKRPLYIETLENRMTIIAVHQCQKAKSLSVYTIGENHQQSRLLWILKIDAEPLLLTIMMMI